LGKSLPCKLVYLCETQPQFIRLLLINFIMISNFDLSYTLIITITIMNLYLSTTNKWKLLIYHIYLCHILLFWKS